MNLLEAAKRLTYAVFILIRCCLGGIELYEDFLNGRICILDLEL